MLTRTHDLGEVGLDPLGLARVPAGEEPRARVDEHAESEPREGHPQHGEGAGGRDEGQHHGQGGEPAEGQSEHRHRESRSWARIRPAM